MSADTQDETDFAEALEQYGYQQIDLADGARVFLNPSIDPDFADLLLRGLVGSVEQMIAITRGKSD